MAYNDTHANERRASRVYGRETSWIVERLADDGTWSSFDGLFVGDIGDIAPLVERKFQHSPYTRKGATWRVVDVLAVADDDDVLTDDGNVVIAQGTTGDQSPRIGWAFDRVAFAGELGAGMSFLAPDHYTFPGDVLTVASASIRECVPNAMLNTYQHNKATVTLTVTTPVTQGAGLWFDVRTPVVVVNLTGE